MLKEQMHATLSDYLFLIYAFIEVNEAGEQGVVPYLLAFVILPSVATKNARLNINITGL